MVFFQAFCLPIIQIVYETMRDIKEGKKGKAGVKGSKLRFMLSNELHVPEFVHSKSICHSNKFCNGAVQQRCYIVNLCVRFLMLNG